MQSIINPSKFDCSWNLEYGIKTYVILILFQKIKFLDIRYLGLIAFCLPLNDHYGEKAISVVKIAEIHFAHSSCGSAHKKENC